MFLHIGNGEIIDTRKIVMIGDVQNTRRGEFSSLKQKVRAAILLLDGSFRLSAISARALCKRIERLGGR
ncbi:hypothetical protein MUO65_08385 [bacterium]|jgi:hypothetical protein|nr:hypothetical protein [bacterium]